MLISFEGIDGCGKSTQIDLLKKHFEQEGIEFSIFREPGGTELSEKVRNLLLHETTEMDPVTELLLFSAARSQLIAEEILPRLKKGEIVILDRFFDSTTAYQGYGRNSVSLEQIEILNKVATHNTVPDVTFYLKIDLETADHRTDGNDKDRMERAGSEFFHKVIRGYDELSKQVRFETIDGTLPPDEIHQLILQRIKREKL
ncbi:dTMP kinase [Rhodohalobacter halophilus]|uniref:dTMP kinase n=1 Tax=Rhodohalobacter halophilus TaxID=1812810 RepID=UPI00083F5589|nr:dTMP kinase [Rhodohalobacter halophilus]